MIRSIQPTDLAALLLFLSKRPYSQAKTRERLGERELPSLSEVVKQCLPLKRKRHTLVHVQRGLIQGLVSARSRSGPSVWEIDRLLLAEGGEGACLDLLQKLSLAGGELGVEKVFLCCRSESSLVEVARQAGFSLYLSEFLYRFEGRVEPATPPDTIRPRLADDEYGLFQLYSTVTPAAVRSAEGVTLQEWRESRGPGSKKEFVYEKEGRSLGWLRIDADGSAGWFEIMVHPLEENSIDQLVKYSLGLLNNKSSILCLAPEFQPRLRQVLVGQDFEEVAEYSNLVKQLVARVREPSLAPAQA